METIVGLIPDDAQIESAERELKAAGFSDKKIHELLGSADFWKRFCSKEKTRLICKDAAVGALIGLGFGSVFGAFPIVLNCASGCPIRTGLLLFVLFVLYCAASGALFGSFIGLDRAERSLLTYINNTHRDQALFMVETSTETTQVARHILERHGTVVDVNHAELLWIERQRLEQ